MKHICRNCKYWYDLYKNNNCGFCNQLTQKEGNYVKCMVYDDSEPIGTQKNFGCIHWRKK